MSTTETILRLSADERDVLTYLYECEKAGVQPRDDGREWFSDRVRYLSAVSVLLSLGLVEK